MAIPAALDQFDGIDVIDGNRIAIVPTRDMNWPSNHIVTTRFDARTNEAFVSPKDNRGDRSNKSIRVAYVDISEVNASVGGASIARMSLHLVDYDSGAMGGGEFFPRELDRSLSGRPKLLSGLPQLVGKQSEEESKDSQKPVREFGGPKFALLFLLLMALTAAAVVFGGRRGGVVLLIGTSGLLGLVFCGWAGVL